PKILDAEVLRFQNNKERWIAFVGLYKNKPYEIFTGKAEDFIVPQWVNNGQITRKEKSKKDERAQYDFSFTDKQGYEVIQPGLSRSFEKEYWNYAKLISGILRHGMPLPFVVELVSNLDLHDETINTWKNGVVRAIKKFIPDGTEVPEKQCPECGAKNALIYKEGCLMCPDCGYSKCG
ncbi:MAG: ribonucleoside-diphosphate reductase, adenosylcobalamin-dependent, partial [Bacteroidetes bacterium]|nr:ribonucleoside-diphosphate reductase, adenosylcobalamin-dependent [Bacteroidota bacterium]